MPIIYIRRPTPRPPASLPLAQLSWLRSLTNVPYPGVVSIRPSSLRALADLPGRQQTLTDTIEWSYDLLSRTS